MLFVVENRVNIAYAVNPKLHNDEFRKPLRLTSYTYSNSILCSFCCPKLHRNFREYVTCKTVIILGDFFSFKRRDKFFKFKLNKKL